MSQAKKDWIQITANRRIVCCFFLLAGIAFAESLKFHVSCFPDYPHFGAGRLNPPPVTQVSFDSVRQDRQPNPSGKLPLGGHRTSGAYPLGPISEQTEDAEYMHDDPRYGHDQQYDMHQGQQPHNESQEDYDEHYMQQPQAYGSHGADQGEYYPHHVQNQPSDQQTEYYRNDQSNGGLYPAPERGTDDGASMYSTHDRTKYV